MRVPLPLRNDPLEHHHHIIIGLVEAQTRMEHFVVDPDVLDVLKADTVHNCAQQLREYLLVIGCECLHVLAHLERLLGGFPSLPIEHEVEQQIGRICTVQQDFVAILRLEPVQERSE